MPKLTENKVISLLKDLGLNGHEAKVYYACLSLGAATILQIANAAELKRTTVYSIIENLQQKGLINAEFKGLKKKFVAENPEKLETILESKRFELKNTLPELTALYNLKGGESSIKYYEGLNGVKNAYESLLADIGINDFYYVVTDESRWRELDKEYFDDFRERRAKKVRKPILLLSQYSELALEAVKFQNNFNMQVKLLPKERKLTTNMIVTPQKVLIHQLVPPISAIVLENKSIIQMHKEMFEIMWQELSK